MEETTKQALIRLPESIHEMLLSEAAKERRSVTAQVTVILEERYRTAKTPEPTQEGAVAR